VEVKNYAQKQKLSVNM